jgi:TPR repeat protein
MRKTLWCIGAFAATACGPGALTKQLAERPKLAVVECKSTGAAEPLIVEWPAAERARLESMARNGLVAVRYDQCKLQLVPACRAAGTYSFTALTRKRERVTIKDATDLYAKVPFGAAGLEGKLKQSGELSVDMMIVGRLESDRASVRQDELTGECAGVTHFVTGLTTGAFRFFAGAGAEASASASAFGAGAGGSSSSSNELLNEDGDFASCSGANDASKAPPAGCGSLMRLDIVAIGEEKLCPPNTAWKGKACVSTRVCPGATDRIFGSCVEMGFSPNLSAACESADIVACEAECTAKNAESCGDLSSRYGYGSGVPTDAAKAASFARKGCDLGGARACANLGSAYGVGSGVSLDPAKSLALFTRACDLGLPLACGYLGHLYVTGESIGVTKDPEKGIALLRKACEARNGLACRNLGIALYNAQPTGDVKGSHLAYLRGCQLNEPSSCASVAGRFQLGDTAIGVAKDEATALKFYRAACEGGLPDGCMQVASFMVRGGPTPKDPAASVRYYTMACNGESPAACYYLGENYRAGYGVPADSQRANVLYRRSCELGFANGCAALETNNAK